MSKNFLTPIGIFTAGGDPPSASNGNMYFNSSSNVLRVFYTSSWHSIVPNTASYGITADYFDFNTAATVSSSYGRLKWNDTDGTLDIGMKGGNVVLQVGQEQLVRIVNKTGADLLESEYRVVKLSSAQGQRPSVILAKADSDPNSTNTVGLVTENILNNEEGYVTNSGFVREIDTTGSLQGETWSDGNILYLSGASAGYLTNIKPSAPTHTVIVGFVTYAHQNHGKIFVKVDNGYEIDELHNVDITSPTNNQSLLYNSSASLWQNNTLSSVASATISSSATIANHANTASAINALLLTGTTFPAAIVSSSLTGVGTLANLTVTNTISGRAASATVATHAGTASSIAGSLVTGTVASATISASSRVSASIDAGGITSGTLSVVRGGTGVTSSTGTGSVVLSNTPTLTGILNAASATFSGTLTASNVNISGSITTASLTSTSGIIAGWTLSASALTAGTSASTVGLISTPQTDNIAIYAGSTTPSSAPFRVTQTGSAFATTKTSGDSSTAIATTAFVSNMIRYNSVATATTSSVAGYFSLSVSPGTGLTGIIMMPRGTASRVIVGTVDIGINGAASAGFVRGYVESNAGVALALATSVPLYYIAW
jgi:hypothetical protein